MRTGVVRYQRNIYFKANKHHCYLVQGRRSQSPAVKLQVITLVGQWKRYYARNESIQYKSQVVKGITPSSLKLPLRKADFLLIFLRVGF